MKYVYRFRTSEDKQRALDILNKEPDKRKAEIFDYWTKLEDRDIITKHDEKELKEILPDFYFELIGKRKIKLIERLGELLLYIIKFINQITP